MKYTSTNGCLFYYDRALYSWKICEPTMLFLLGFEAVTMYDKSQSDHLTLTKYIYQTDTGATIDFKDFKIWDDIYNFLAKSGYIEDFEYYIKYNCYGLKLLMNELTGTENDRTVPIIFKNDSNQALIDLNDSMFRVKNRDRKTIYDLQAQKIIDIFSDADYTKTQPEIIDVYKDGLVNVFNYKKFNKETNQDEVHRILIDDVDAELIRKNNIERIAIHNERYSNREIHKHIDYKAMYSYALGVLYGCRCLGYNNELIWRFDPTYWYKDKFMNLVHTAWHVFRFHYSDPLYMNDPELREKYQAIQLNKLWNLAFDEDSNVAPEQYEQLVYKASNIVDVKTDKSIESLIYRLPDDDDLKDSDRSKGVYVDLSDYEEKSISDKIVDSSPHLSGIINSEEDPIIRYLGDYPIKIYPAYRFDHKVYDSAKDSFVKNSSGAYKLETTILSPNDTEIYFIATGNVGWAPFDENSWREYYQVKDQINDIIFPIYTNAIKVKEESSLTPVEDEESGITPLLTESKYLFTSYLTLTNDYFTVSSIDKKTHGIHRYKIADCTDEETRENELKRQEELQRQLSFFGYAFNHTNRPPRSREQENDLNVKYDAADTRSSMNFLRALYDSDSNTINSTLFNITGIKHQIISITPLTNDATILNNLTESISIDDVTITRDINNPSFVKCSFTIKTSEALGLEPSDNFNFQYKTAIKPLNKYIHAQDAKSILTYCPITFDRLIEKDTRIHWAYDNKTHEIKAYYNSNTVVDANEKYQIYGIFHSDVIKQQLHGQDTPEDKNDDVFKYIYDDPIIFMYVYSKVQFDSLYTPLENFENSNFILTDYFDLSTPLQLYVLKNNQDHYFDGRLDDDGNPVYDDNNLISKTGYSLKESIPLDAYNYNAEPTDLRYCKLTKKFTYDDEGTLVVEDNLAYEKYWSTNWLDIGEPYWKDQTEYENISDTAKIILVNKEIQVPLYKNVNLLNENAKLYYKYLSDIKYKVINGHYENTYPSVEKIDEIYNDLSFLFYVKKDDQDKTNIYDVIETTAFITLETLHDYYGITAYMCSPVTTDDFGNSLLNKDKSVAVWYDSVYNKYWDSFIVGEHVNKWVDYKPFISDEFIYNAFNKKVIKVIDDLENKQVYTQDDYNEKAYIFKPYSDIYPEYTFAESPMYKTEGITEKITLPNGKTAFCIKILNEDNTNIVIPKDKYADYVLLSEDKTVLPFNNDVEVVIESAEECKNSSYVFINPINNTYTVSDFTKVKYIAEKVDLNGVYILCNVKSDGTAANATDDFNHLYVQEANKQDLIDHGFEIDAENRIIWDDTWSKDYLDFNYAGGCFIKDIYSDENGENSILNNQRSYMYGYILSKNDNTLSISYNSFKLLTSSEQYKTVRVYIRFK